MAVALTRPEHRPLSRGYARPSLQKAGRPGTRCTPRDRRHGWRGMAVVWRGVGWGIAGGVLRPVGQMKAGTQGISADSLDERLGMPGPYDELKELGDTIDGLLERLEGAFAAQRRFVANASHELRTPLTTMRASLDVAVAKPRPVPASTIALAGRLRTELHRVDQLLVGF